MISKLNKSLTVGLVIVAVLALGSFGVFAANVPDGISVSASRGISASSDGSGMETSTPEPTRVVGEDIAFTGTISAINGMVYTIGDMLVTTDASTELDSGLIVGAEVKVEAFKLADGTLLAKEIETVAGDDLGTEIEQPGGDDDGNDIDKMDDHGNDIDKVDDHGTDFGKVDDHGTDFGKVDDHSASGGQTERQSGSSRVDDQGKDAGKVDDHGGSSGKSGSSKP